MQLNILIDQLISSHHYIIRLNFNTSVISSLYKKSAYLQNPNTNT